MIKINGVIIPKFFVNKKDPKQIQNTQAKMLRKAKIIRKYFMKFC